MEITMNTNISKVDIIKYIKDNFSDGDVVIKKNHFELHDEYSSIKIIPTLAGTLTTTLDNLNVEQVIELSNELYFKTAMSGFEYTLTFEANCSKLVYKGAWNAFDSQNLLPFGSFDYWDGWCTSSIFGNKTIAAMQELRPSLDALRASGSESQKIRKEINPPCFKSLLELTDDEIMIQTPNGYVPKSEFNPKDYHSPHGRGLFNAYVIEGYAIEKSCESKIINGKEYFFAGSENYTLVDIINYIGIL